ncbi:peptidyl dipeptidase, putative [Leishmania panamensis]|uniref:Peptidyl dipeptidase, putative n=1 Tax=Leishmania panamensis TaxID=5679 RepID=A0AC62A6M5_LEIPA
MDTRRTALLIVADAAELEGLSEDEIATAQKEAESLGHPGKHALVIVNTTQQPLLASLRNRETRRRLLEASEQRAGRGDENGTTAITVEIAQLRLRRATLLGKKSFAEWQLQNQMADLASAEALLRDMGKAAAPKATKEAADIQQMIREEGGDFELAPWDWRYYAERVRRQLYDLDENEAKPYFELNNALERGVFYAAEKLYGVTMQRRTDLPVYHPDVMTLEMFDCTGESLAIFGIDPYARAGKRGGAWMTFFVRQASLLGRKPVVYNVLNTVKPAEGRPALLTRDNLTALYHEFGHGLHGMLSNLQYSTLSGTSVARDFLEFPSQINEHWAMYDAVLKNYALHYETKEPIPQALVDRMKAAETYGAGLHTIEVDKAAYLDLHWHRATEEAAMRAFGVGMTEVPPRYHSGYFLHIVAGGYASNYYVYQWARVLDCDGLEWFLESGGLTRENGDHLRACVRALCGQLGGRQRCVREVRWPQGQHEGVPAHQRSAGRVGLIMMCVCLRAAALFLPLPQSFAFSPFLSSSLFVSLVFAERLRQRGWVGAKRRRSFHRCSRLCAAAFSVRQSRPLRCFVSPPFHHCASRRRPSSSPSPSAWVRR